MSESVLFGLLASIILQNTLMYYRIGKIEQEVRDLKKYVLHLNSD